MKDAQKTDEVGTFPAAACSVVTDEQLLMVAAHLHHDATMGLADDFENGRAAYLEAAKIIERHATRRERYLRAKANMESETYVKGMVYFTSPNVKAQGIEAHE